MLIKGNLRVDKIQQYREKKANILSKILLRCIVTNISKDTVTEDSVFKVSSIFTHSINT